MVEDKKHLFVEDIAAGSHVSDIFVLAEKSMAHKRDGNPFLNITLADKTGRIKGVVWDNVDQIAGAANAGDFVRVAATAGEFRGTMQLVVKSLVGIDADGVHPDDFIAASARNVDVLIADTAGRLHTKSNLMEELAKIARVMKKIDPDAPHEVMLVVDATTGQNALNQAQQFHQAVGLTGITMTKMDGTAKGGILFAIAERLQLPIRFIGVGESIEDLRPFESQEFVDALFE
jgi:fused signal recognition particle receptor